MLPSDSIMIEGAFNIFLVVTELKSLFPDHPVLEGFRLDVVKMI